VATSGGMRLGEWDENAVYITYSSSFSGMYGDFHFLLKSPPDKMLKHTIP
jgi:hypothetical protein